MQAGLKLEVKAEKCNVFFKKGEKFYLNLTIQVEFLSILTLTHQSEHDSGIITSNTNLNSSSYLCTKNLVS